MQRVRNILSFTYIQDFQSQILIVSALLATAFAAAPYDANYDYYGEGDDFGKADVTYEGTPVYPPEPKKGYGHAPAYHAKRSAIDDKVPVAYAPAPVNARAPAYKPAPAPTYAPAKRSALYTLPPPPEGGKLPPQPY